MKANERHQLKQNEFANTAARVAEAAAANRQRIILALGGVAVVVALLSGFLWWRGRSANEAGAALGVAMATAQSEVVPAPTLPGATQQPGTFPTEQARTEATLKAFNDVVTRFPGTDAAMAAQYQAAAELLAAGKTGEAETAFAAVVARAGNGFYAPLAKLGQAQAMLAAGKTAEGLAIISELSANRDGALPVDGLLMELGKASVKAGKPAEARAAFKRVVDEFPDSMYTADAQQRLAALN